jgi:hypothetical protein
MLCFTLTWAMQAPAYMKLRFHTQNNRWFCEFSIVQVSPPRIALFMMLFKSALAVLAFYFSRFASAQLATGYPLGPLTTSDDKWAIKVCDVTKYGAVADGSTDLGPPLLAAFDACKDGGIGGLSHIPVLKHQAHIFK